MYPSLMRVYYIFDSRLHKNYSSYLASLGWHSRSCVRVRFGSRVSRHEQKIIYVNFFVTLVLYWEDE
jgi:hypothetical protein